MPSPDKALYQISVAELSRLLGAPEAPRIIDVRIEDDVAADPQLLPTARRHPFHDCAALVPQLRGQRVVVYCQKGKKISEGAAAVLRAGGVAAEVLLGGHFAWRDADEALLPLAKIPDTGSAWVCDQRPRIERAACAWLIRRFIDADARLLCVPATEALAVAEKFNAVPFALVGAAYGEHSERNAFDAMLDDFELRSGALQRVADVLRGDCHAPQQPDQDTPGVLAVWQGIRGLYPDALQQLDAAAALFDALYYWARSTTAHLPEAA